MTQARLPGGTGSQQTNSTTQLPEALTVATIPSLAQRCVDMVRERHVEVPANTTVLESFTAPNNGRISGLRVSNTTVATSATVGGRITVVNQSNSDAEILDYGIGGNTNSDAADAQTVTIAADANLEVANPKTIAAANRFNKGDLLTFTFTPDGTTWKGGIDLIFEYGSDGR